MYQLKRFRIYTQSPEKTKAYGNSIFAPKDQFKYQLFQPII